MQACEGALTANFPSQALRPRRPGPPAQACRRPGHAPPAGVVRVAVPRRAAAPELPAGPLPAAEARPPRRSDERPRRRLSGATLRRVPQARHRHDDGRPPRLPGAPARTHTGTEGRRLWRRLGRRGKRASHRRILDAPERKRPNKRTVLVERLCDSTQGSIRTVRRRNMAPEKKSAEVSRTCEKSPRDFRHVGTEEAEGCGRAKRTVPVKYVCHSLCGSFWTVLQGVAVPEKKSSEVNRAFEKSPWDLDVLEQKKPTWAG